MKYLGRLALWIAALCPATTWALPPPPGSSSAERRDNGINPQEAADLIQKEYKYFHEPGGGDLMGHYDSRFYHGIVSYEERTDTLTHMIRAYLNFFREKGLETWIAHGTLLGWWWNGKVRRAFIPQLLPAFCSPSRLQSACTTAHGLTWYAGTRCSRGTGISTRR